MFFDSLFFFVHLRPWPCTRAPSRPMVSEIPMLRAPYILKEPELRIWIEDAFWDETLHQTPISPLARIFCLFSCSPITRYLYDIRWVRGWNSIYGHSERKNFVQLWATLPQHTSTMAHLLQQGAVLSTSFQPFEATTFWGVGNAGDANKPLHCHWRMYINLRSRC